MVDKDLMLEVSEGVADRICWRELWGETSKITPVPLAWALRGCSCSFQDRKCNRKNINFTKLLRHPFAISKILILKVTWSPFFVRYFLNLKISHEPGTYCLSPFLTKYLQFIPCWISSLSDTFLNWVENRIFYFFLQKLTLQAVSYKLQLCKYFLFNCGKGASIVA